MSQKNAKRIRRLEGRMDAWERAVNAVRLEEVFTLTQQRNDERHRASAAERAAATYRTLLNLGLVVAVLALAVAILLAVRMKGIEVQPVQKPTAAATATTTAVTPADKEPEPVTFLQPANYIADCTVTFYCVCEECCGKAPDHPAYGITASGRLAEPYVSVGVDPTVIPLGSTVSMDIGDGRGEQLYRADDTGSGVIGNHIDVCVSDHRNAEELGCRTASVIWTAPEDAA